MCLVEAFAVKNNIHASIALCEHKNLGSQFYFNILLKNAEKGLYQELKSIFNQYPVLKQPERQTELQILTRAYLEAKRKHANVDDDFEELFNSILKVDRKIRAGDFKLQDQLLMELGEASSGNKERVSLCKKAIKNIRMKRELDYVN